ncbi:MAG TPA: hypothetical protein VF154_03075 [Terriglobales bacterium]
MDRTIPPDLEGETDGGVAVVHLIAVPDRAAADSVTATAVFTPLLWTTLTARA